MDISVTLNISKSVPWRDYLYDTFCQIYNLFKSDINSFEVNDTNFIDSYNEKPEKTPTAIEYRIITKENSEISVKRIILKNGLKISAKNIKETEKRALEQLLLN